MSKVSFSYHHKDKRLRIQLEAHLAQLKNQGLIESWHDRRIVAGSEVGADISENMENMENMEAADIILLLASSDSLASSYCYSIEMTRAVERHEAREARVIPVILHDCDGHSAPFRKLTAVPTDGKPVRSWPDRVLSG